EDRFAEVYLALASHIDASGREWIKVRLPQRPNGRTGWVAREALGDFRINRQHLLIDRARLRATLRVDGKVVWRARIGVGKRGTATPAGRFYVREIFKVSGQPMYGTFAIGTSAYSPTLSDWPKGGIIGISLFAPGLAAGNHGTNQPQLIPGRPSHGCIRVRNADIAKLRKLIRIGTPIEIK
ncbi:MAG TPA: L,D-transpeptidase, partial [Baekduia sp.]|nr:L,D-transpeptidase [Baekduia sp.]